MPIRRLLLLGCASVLITVGVACHLEDRTPAGSRRDDAAIRAVVSTYYEALEARAWDRYRELFAPGAVVQRPTSPTGSDHALFPIIPIDSVLANWPPDSAVSRESIRILRTDVRQRNDIAAAWVTLGRPGSARGARERVDLFVLERYGAGWRILLLTPGPVALENG